MPKVLIYRNELLPGSETFVLAQAAALSRYVPVFAGVRRVFSGLDLAPYAIATVSASERLREKLLRRLFFQTGRSGRLEEEIAWQRPSLVHAHFAVDACAILPMARRWRLPLLVTLHGYDIGCHDAALRRWPAGRTYLRRRMELWQYASLFFCVSSNVRRQALLRGFPPDKLFVHPVGVAVDRPATSAEGRERSTILFVGRLVEKKGCADLLRAMPLVLRQVPGARLVILGDGPLRKVLEQMAVAFRGNVIFHGHQPHQQVKQWMRRARVLVAPSICASDGDQEGLPTVLCEAQAAGLPVVTFATDAVLEALPKMLRGFMPPERDIAGLAETIVRFVLDDALWQCAHVQGRRYIEEHFDLARQTRILEEKYDECLSQSGQALS
ncbi:MAG: glycosyltransferase [Bacillota bacterium]|nr:glycosyltransferase [Bacillota bacterium]